MARPPSETNLEQALDMGDGYVLDFSDRAFNDFFSSP